MAGWIYCSSGGLCASANVKKNICSVHSTRCLANSPRSGGRDAVIGLKITTKGEDTVRRGIILGPPTTIPADLFEEVGGSKRTVGGMGWLGRISLGRFLTRPPLHQVSSVCIGGGGGSSLNTTSGSGWTVDDQLHCEYPPLPPYERRIYEDTEPEMMAPPPQRFVLTTVTGGGAASSANNLFIHSATQPILPCDMVQCE